MTGWTRQTVLIYPMAGLNDATKDAIATAYAALGLETFADERAMFDKAAAASSDYGATETHRQIASAMTEALWVQVKAALSGAGGTWYLLDATTGALLDTNDAAKKSGNTVTHGLDWAAGIAVTAGEVLRYQGRVYEVAQGHTTQADWTPDIAVALFKPYLPPGEALVWRQPLGAHDAYPVGARVTYDDKTWINEQAANVWQPGVTGWRDEAAPTTPAWVQPTGAHDAYALDAVVTHAGATWRSLYNNNVWEPGVFGWVQI